MRRVLFAGFITLFLFVTFNREFAFFHFDARYLVVAIGLACAFFTLIDISKSHRIYVGGLEASFFVYYAFVLFSFFAFVWNRDNLDIAGFPGVAVVHLLNILSFVLVVLNKDLLVEKRVCRLICISGIALAVSQIAVYLGFDIGALLTDGDVRVKAVDQGQGEHINFFGQYFRVAGFAEDPNYACLFNIISIAVACKIRKSSSKLFAMTVLLSSFGILLAWSRTVVFGSIGIVLLVAIARRTNAAREIYVGFLALLVPIALALPFMRIEILQTITTRYTLWQNAFDLFMQSPFFGNGLTSFRFYNASVQNGWLVHPHSSLWETLSEFGLIAFLALVLVYAFALRRTANDPFFGFCVALTVLFSINFDCTYLQITIVTLLVFPLLSDPVQQGSKESSARRRLFHGYGRIMPRKLRSAYGQK